MANLLLLRHAARCGPSMREYARLESGSANPEHGCPFGKSVRFSLIFKACVVSLVVSLVFACGPATVLGRVGSVVISSINRVLLGWSLPHVGKEVFKLQPAFADSDAASTVVLPGRLIRVGASLAYTTPNIPFWCPGSSMSAIVRSDPILAHVLLSPLSAIASATDHSSRTQRNLEDSLLDATITSHSPAWRAVSLPRQILGSGSHDKSTEALSFEVHFQHVAENFLRGQA